MRAVSPTAAACSPDLDELGAHDPRYRVRAVRRRDHQRLVGSSAKLEGWRHGDTVVVARLLPCAYDASVKKLVNAIEALRPDALLMTGQAARRGVVGVERFGRNLDDASAPDNDGALRRALRISRDAPERPRRRRRSGQIESD